MAFEGGVQSLVDQHPKCDVEAADERDRGRERRVEDVLRLWVRSQSK